MRKGLKWIGMALGGILVLVLVLAGISYLIGSAKVDRTYQVATASLMLPADSAEIAHGAHLSRIHGCTDCHGENLGGRVFLDVPPFRVTASNLTSGQGGVGQRYSTQDFDRAIRHGIKADGQAVLVMPSAAFHNLSDQDAAALIAYLQTVPPVDNVLPPTEVRAPGRIMAVGAFDPAFEVRLQPARAAAPPPAGPTVAYGEYLASITCAYCHGADLRGNAQPPVPGSPPAPDLAAAGQWTVEMFKETLRTGVRPGGVPLNPEYMPWQLTAAMKDAELEALHAYLATLANTAGQE